MTQSCGIPTVLRGSCEEAEYHDTTRPGRPVVDTTMTTHPTPRRAPAPETLDDVFTAIIPSSSSAPRTVDKLGKGKMDPLQRRLSMMTGRKRDPIGVIRGNRAEGIRRTEVVNRTEKMNEENTGRLLVLLLRDSSAEKYV